MMKQRLQYWGRGLLWLTALLLAGWSQAAAPFLLEDSNPSSAYFKKRFLASYGVNEAIEPVLDQSDRPLYERVLPLIEKNPQQAYDMLRREVNRDSNAAFDFLLGSLAYQIDRLDDSKAWMESAVRKFPSFRRAWLTLSLVLVRQDQFKQAIPPLLKVISLGGGDAQSYGLLAYAWLSEEKYQSALAAYQQALMFDANSKDFRRGLAHCLLMTEQHERAAALFDELIADFPEDADSWLYQANAWLALQQYPRAVGNLEIVRSLGKASSDSLYLLGDLYLREDIPQLALQAYSDAVKKSSEPQMNTSLRALNYFVERLYLDEADSLITLIKQRGATVKSAEWQESLQLAEAVFLQKKQQHEQALALLLPLVAKNPLHGVALLRVADSYHAQENYAQTEFYLERAVLVPSQQVEALIALGRMEVARGNLKAALPYLRRAQSIQPQTNILRLIEQLEQSL